MTLVIPLDLQGFSSLQGSPIIVSNNRYACVPVFSQNPVCLDYLTYTLYLKGLAVIIANEFASQYHTSFHRSIDHSRNFDVYSENCLTGYFQGNVVAVQGFPEYLKVLWILECGVFGHLQF